MVAPGRQDARAGTQNPEHMPKGGAKVNPRGQQETRKEGYSPTCWKLQGYKLRSYKAYRDFKAVNIIRLERIERLKAYMLQKNPSRPGGPQGAGGYIYMYMCVYIHIYHVY